MWLIKLIQIKLWYRQSKHLETSKTAERSEFTYLNLKKNPNNNSDISYFYSGPGRTSLSHAPFDSDSPLDDDQFFSDGKTILHFLGKINS